MSKKKNFLTILENQVDKIVLGVIVLVSLVLLWVYVIGGPYSAKVKVGGRDVKLSPSQIDRKVAEEAERLIDGLERSAVSEKYSKYDKNLSEDYQRKLGCSIADIPDIFIPYPGVGEAIEEERLYAVPGIPPLSEVETAVLRGAVQIPVEEIGPGTPYSSAKTKMGDIDLVTVSGRFDIQRLYNNFQLSFVGANLKSSWRDTRLAKPVLAGVELQRRILQPDGSWSDWSAVPRTKVDMYKKLLEQLPLRTEDMQFGVDIWMSQYEGTDVQLDILQPEPYQFAVSRVNWMPPQYLQETYKILEKEKEQQRRESTEARRRSLETERLTPERGGTGRMPRPTPRPAPRPAPERRGDARDIYAPAETPETAAAARKTERTQQDVQRDVQKDTLKTGTRLESLRDAVLVWVHDDTVQPGKTYEYRVRIGVFNPITGKNWFRKDQAEFKDQTVLWSDYTSPTGAVEIPKMLHVFPMEVLYAKTDSKQVEGVKAEVDKYYMGKWHSQVFDVYPGQIIGYPLEDVKESENQPDDGENYAEPITPAADGSADAKVDYSSGMTLVDVVKNVNWGIRMRRTDLYNMLYSDVNGLLQLAIGKANWPAVYKKAYDTVQEELKETVEERDRRMTPLMPDMPGMPGMPGGMPGMPGMPPQGMPF